jgi:hypothetical protein
MWLGSFQYQSFGFGVNQAVASISRNPNIVLVPDMPSAVALFHEYVSTATAQSTKMVNVEYGLRVRWVETSTREDNQSHIVREFLLKFG